MRICQANLNKSNSAQTTFLHSLHPDHFDIALLQEPHIDFLGVTRSNPRWTTVYPTHHVRDPSTSRSIILVNTHLSSTHWAPIPLPTGDVTAVQFHGSFGTIHIFNVYNDCEHNKSLN
ncbi:Endonuclease/exonuclease/phosphatase, partial [Mycena sp. CBHHK59/15]